MFHSEVFTGTFCIGQTGEGAHQGKAKVYGRQAQERVLEVITR